MNKSDSVWEKNLFMFVYLANEPSSGLVRLLNNSSSNILMCL